MTARPARSRRIGAALLASPLVAVVATSLSGPVPARADDVPADAVVGVVPFVADSPSYRVIIDLAPDGSRAFPLMLDSGASDSVLTPRVARDLGVSARKVKDTPYRRATRLGRDLSFWIDDRRSDTGSATGWEYGLLGGNFLEQYVVEIDFGTRQVRFLDPDRYAVPESVTDPDEAVMPLRMVARQPAVEIGIGEHREWVVLDTGAPPPAILAGKVTSAAGVTSGRVAGLERGGTTVGPMATEFAALPRLSIGPFSWQDVPVIVAPKGWYNIGAPSQSVIGAELLAHFVLRLDYARSRLWLRRLPDARMRLYGADWMRTRSTGVLFEAQKSGAVVGAVWPDGAGARIGLRVGDGVARKADEKDEVLLDRALAAVERGEPLSIVRKVNGTVVDLVLPQDADLAVGAEAPE